MKSRDTGNTKDQEDEEDSESCSRKSIDRDNELGEESLNKVFKCRHKVQIFHYQGCFC